MDSMMKSEGALVEAHELEEELTIKRDIPSTSQAPPAPRAAIKAFSAVAAPRRHLELAQDSYAAERSGDQRCVS